jgi:hypothetical protein
VLVDQVNGRRSASPVKTEQAARKNSSPSRAARPQPQQQQQQPKEDDGNSMSTPVRAAPETAPPAPLAKQLSTGKLDRGKLANFQRDDSANNVVDAAIKRKTSSDNNSSEFNFHFFIEKKSSDKWFRYATYLLLIYDNIQKLCD